MRRHRLRITLSVLTTLTALTFGSLNAAAQSRSVYAITDARIYPVSGPMIARGSIVIRNGLIEAVGGNVSIPPEATVVDGNGLTVFPGLIDAFSDIGTAEQAQPAGAGGGGGRGGRGGRGGPQQAPPQDVIESIFQEARGLSPDRLLATMVSPDGKNVEAARNAGITSALVVSRDGILTGQSVLINTGEDNIVVKTPVGMHVNIQRSGGGYPSTLMGVFAVIRQAAADGAWYSQAWERFNLSPRDMERPAFDPTLAALVPVVAQQLPAVIHANWTNEVKRAIALADELNLMPIIAGGMEASNVADLLREKDIPVLLSVNYDNMKPKPGFGGSGGDIEYDAEDLDRFQTNASLLAAAGVRFALQSGFGDQPGDFISNIRLTIEKGLSLEQALRATTLTAAEILGVGDALGSLEAGKIANLVLATGDPFASDTELRSVWVDGRAYDMPETSAAASRSEDGTETGPRRGGRRGRGGRGAAEAATNERRAINKPGSYITDGPNQTIITNGTVLTITDGTIEGGDVLIRDGKIVAIGTDLATPTGARVIDATGKFVMPGIIDAHSHMAIEGGGNEGASTITPNVRIADVIREDDISIYRALAGGTTIVNVLHGSANVIGGTNAVLKLKWGKPVEDLFFGAPLGIKFALGENPKRSRSAAQQVRRYPATRMGVQHALRESFTLAREYRKKWDTYEEARARGDDPVQPRRNLKLETLAEVLRGNILVHAHCYRADEIVMLLNIADEFGFKIKTLQHVLEGYKVAQEIAAHGAAGSTFVDFWSYKMEAWDAIPYNAAIMAQYGVNVSLNSDSDERVRRLYQEAAKAVRYGNVSQDDALKMVTINPAMQLEIDDRVGSLEVGKDGDIAIFSEHPLSNYANVEMTLIEGQVYFDREQDIATRTEGTTNENN